MNEEEKTKLFKKIVNKNIGIDKIRQDFEDIPIDPFHEAAGIDLNDEIIKNSLKEYDTIIKQTATDETDLNEMDKWGEQYGYEEDFFNMIRASKLLRNNDTTQTN